MTALAFRWMPKTSAVLLLLLLLVCSCRSTRSMALARVDIDYSSYRQEMMASTNNFPEAYVVLHPSDITSTRYFQVMCLERFRAANLGHSNSGVRIAWRKLGPDSYEMLARPPFNDAKYAASLSSALVATAKKMGFGMKLTISEVEKTR